MKLKRNFKFFLALAGDNGRFHGSKTLGPYDNWRQAEQAAQVIFNANPKAKMWMTYGVPDFKLRIALCMLLRYGSEVVEYGCNLGENRGHKLYVENNSEDPGTEINASQEKDLDEGSEAHIGQVSDTPTDETPKEETSKTRGRKPKPKSEPEPNPEPEPELELELDNEPEAQDKDVVKPNLRPYQYTYSYSYAI